MTSTQTTLWDTPDTDDSTDDESDDTLTITSKMVVAALNAAAHYQHELMAGIRSLKDREIRMKDIDDNELLDYHLERYAVKVLDAFAKAGNHYVMKEL